MMHNNVELEIRAELAQHLNRLWRYGLILSGNSDTAEELVQATCVRALERTHQFAAGSRLDRWLISILHSVWLNELRARRIRQGQGLVDAEIALVFEGADAIEMTVMARQALKEVQSLPQASRETLFLVFVKGLTYREAAETLDVPIGTVMSRLAAARARLVKLSAEPASTF